MNKMVTSAGIKNKIFQIRGKNVMLDRDLAELYEVTTGNLNKAVRRNIERFPDDFMFQLSKQEADSLRFQSGILKRGQHAKYLPHVFTEQGVAMLSSVLNSKRAALVNIAIMRVFVGLRRMALTHQQLRHKINAMEKKYDKRFKVIFETIRDLLDAP